MGVSEILVQIDREIVKLQQARNLLVEGTGRTSKTVSYTHLDVYKRQLLEVVNRAVEPSHASVWIRRRE